MNRLALLVPARNASALLPRLLASVDAQVEPFDEVLVYDDASQDETGDVARRWGARVLRGDRPMGPSHGKNVLARATACEWIHFHDADDALGPEFVRRARRWMSSSETDVVLFGTEDRDDATDLRLGGRSWDDAALQADAVAYAIRHTITNCGVYRRSAFVACGGFDTDPAVQYNEDQALHLRLARAGLRYRADAYTGVIIYRRQNSMSSAHQVECVRAQVEVLDRAAAATGAQHGEPIRFRAWRLAAVAAGYSDWPTVRRSLAVARSVGRAVPHEEHWLVRLVGFASPVTAVRARELFVRTFKPGLRREAPPLPAEPLSAGDRSAGS